MAEALKINNMIKIKCFICINFMLIKKIIL
jgi:hypothetical protein